MATKIEILRTWGGRESKERYFYPGVYELDDPGLNGLGQHMLDIGVAVELKKGDDREAIEAEPLLFGNDREMNIREQIEIARAAGIDQQTGLPIEPVEVNRLPEPEAASSPTNPANVGDQVIANTENNPGLAGGEKTVEPAEGDGKVEKKTTKSESKAEPKTEKKS